MNNNPSVSSRFFDPWVGDLYQTEGFLNKRLLLLGESYYLPPGGGVGAYPRAHAPPLGGGLFCTLSRRGREGATTKFLLCDKNCKSI